MPKKEYCLEVEFCGIPAYVIDKLVETGLYGTTKEGIIEGMVSDWIVDHMDHLETLNITATGAKTEGYIPIIRTKGDDS